MTNEEYHKADGISASDFRLLQESPLHLDNKDLFKLEGSQFTIGSLVHKMVLEPDTVEDEFCKEDFEGCDLNKNSKAYKEAKASWLESVGDRTVVSANDWREAEKMANNVIAIAGGLLQNGNAEESFFVDDPIYNIRRKCRPDYYREDMKACIDLKTTGDGTDWSFGSSLYKYNYFLQAAWYIDTLAMAGKDIETFIFITVETKPPYMVRVRELNQTAIMVGRGKYEGMLNEYVAYKKSGIADVVRGIDLPKYVYEEEMIA